MAHSSSRYETQELRKHGIPINLFGQPIQVLLVLTANPGRLVTRGELQQKLWPGGNHGDPKHGLNAAVNKLREKLGDSATTPTYVETLPGRGYRFVAEVCEVPDDKNVGAGLVIESHSRGTVVVEEEDEDDHEASELVAGSLPQERNFRRAYWLILLAVAAAALVWFALPPQPPRLLASNQISNDGRLKWPKWQGIFHDQGPMLLTDGSRIYAVEDTGLGSSTLVQLPVSGGQTVPVPVPWTRFQITDMDRQRSELLLLKRQGVALETPLWTYSVVNGGYRRVGDLNVSDATWAADGHILFTRGEELWSAASDGSEERLLVKLPGIPGGPRESPDRRVIRFTLKDPQTSSTSLWEVSRDGKNPHPLLQGWNNSPRECCGSWTPDGRYYVFQSLRDGRRGIWALREHGVLIRGYRGPFQLTTGPIDYVAPRISLDGKRLFAIGMQSRNGLMRFDHEKNQFIPFLPELAATSLAFSKDGDWVAYTSDVDGQLWRARADGSNRQQLTFPPLIAAQPSWSPDGKRIAFIAGQRGTLKFKVYVVLAEGGPAKELLSESLSEFDPTWSPDGKRLAFGRLPGGLEGSGSQPAIFIVELETRELSKIPGSDGLFSPRWSPGGQLAALTAVEKHLVLYDATKRTWRELVDDKVAFPRWSHDDKYIYFDTPGGVVCRVDLHSRKIERITSLENLRLGGTFGAWSGLTPDDTPLFTRDAGSQEIYTFELELP